MVDVDSETLRNERKTRRFGFALSVAIQAALLSTLVLVPLLAPEALPTLLSIVQLPLLQAPPPIQVAAETVENRQPREMVYEASTSSKPAIVSRRELSNFSDAATDFVPNTGMGALNPLALFGSAGQPRPPEPAAAHEAARPIARSSGVMEALLINRVQPAYPAIALATRTSGSVVLSAIIAKDGAIQSLTLVSGSPLFANAALTAVRQWRYKPTLLNGEPVEVATLITVNFVLE
jgi:protein TonB